MARSKGEILELVVLGLLQDGDRHGYDLRKGMVELFGPGMLVSFGSLYPALARLERAGALQSVGRRAAAAPPAPAAVTGALTGERPLRSRGEGFRQRHQERRARVDVVEPTSTDRRRKKTYRITDEGRRHLVDLLRRADASDDRVFPVVVAFAASLPPADRQAAVRRRRHAVEDALADRRATRPGAGAGPYRRSLADHDERALVAELAWLDELDELATADPFPTAPPTEPAPDGDAPPSRPPTATTHTLGATT